MPPLQSSDQVDSLPRLIIYHQTHHDQFEQPISILPLVHSDEIRITHIILAAVHLNSPTSITLNDHDPAHPRNNTLWEEVKQVQAKGIKVMAMLGGAAKGSFLSLDGDDISFEAYYTLLYDFLTATKLDGVDLDVEEEMSLGGVCRLIDRLRSDFPAEFMISLAPVAAAMFSSDPKHNLSGFDYEILELTRGDKIDWYNCQFYCGWGDLRTTEHYNSIIARGFSPEKCVIGTVTNKITGAGWVELDDLRIVLEQIQSIYPSFGGVMGWEYWNSSPGDEQKPWEWARILTEYLKR